MQEWQFWLFCSYFLWIIIMGYCLPWLQYAWKYFNDNFWLECGLSGRRFAIFYAFFITQELTCFCICVIQKHELNPKYLIFQLSDLFIFLSRLPAFTFHSWLLLLLMQQAREERKNMLCKSAKRKPNQIKLVKLMIYFPYWNVFISLHQISTVESEHCINI